MSARSERDHRYNTSAKGRARHRAYNASEKGRERRKRRYYKNKAEGRCVSCGDVALSETLCWGCLSRKIVL